MAFTTTQLLSKAQTDLKLQTEKVTELNKQIDSLKTAHQMTLDGLGKQLNDAIAARRAADSAYKTLEGRYKLKVEDYNEKVSEVAGLQARIRGLEKTELAHAELQKNFEALDKAKGDADTLITQLRNARTRLQGENTELAGKLLNFEKNQLDLANLRKTLATERQQRQEQETQLNQQLEQQKAELETLRQQLEGDVPDTSVAQVVTETGMGLKTAQDALKRSGSGFRVGKLSMDLKMVPAAGGSGIRFPSKDELASGMTQFSTVSMDFSPEETSTETEQAYRVAPRLRGYTETMARRKLAAQGINLDVSFEPVTREEGKANMVGRVVNQWPASGELLGNDNTILVSIGKAADASQE
ncbi:MAG: hypothetical protein ACPG4N_00045 [Gammaproteobacteria bacterium]